MTDARMTTTYQEGVAACVMASFAALEWPLVHDSATVRDVISAAAPSAPDTDPCPSAWLDAMLRITAERVMVPTPRGTRLQDALAHRYSRIIVAAVLALRAPTRLHIHSDEVTLAVFEVTSFLRQFPIDRYPLIPGDALTPRIEYREALNGAALIAHQVLDQQSHS